MRRSLEEKLEWKNVNNPRVKPYLFMEHNVYVEYIDLEEKTLQPERLERLRQRLSFIPSFYSFFSKISAQTDPREIVAKNPNSFEIEIMNGLKEMAADFNKILSQEEREKKFDLSFAVLFFYGPYFLYCHSDDCELHINGRKIDKYGLDKEVYYQIGKREFYGIVSSFNYISRPSEIKLEREDGKESFSFVYYSETEYGQIKPSNNKAKKCARKMPDAVYSQGEKGPLYYYKGVLNDFDYSCGRVSYESLKDCNMSGLIPERQLGNLRRGERKLEVGNPPAYYCSTQIERDNPDYKILGKETRVVRGGSEIAKKGQRTKPQILEEACRQGLTCKKFYDPLDALRYTSNKYETPISKDTLYPLKFMSQEVEVDKLGLYLGNFYANTTTVYPLAYSLLAKDFNPEICISGVSMEDEFIFATQPITRRTRVFIFYIVPSYGTQDGHARSLVVDFAHKVIAPLDSYFVSAKTKVIKDQAADLCILRLQNTFEDDEFGTFLIPTADGLQEDDLSSFQDDKFYSDEFYQQMLIKDVYKCPENRESVRSGAQSHSMGKDMSCFIWSIFYLFQFLQNYETLKTARKFYVSLEKDINAAVIARGGIPRTITSFYIFIVESIIRMEEKEKSRLGINQRDYNSISLVAMQLWEIDPLQYTSYANDVFGQRNYEEFFDAVRHREDEAEAGYGSQGEYEEDGEYEEEGEEFTSLPAFYSSRRANYPPGLSPPGFSRPLMAEKSKGKYPPGLSPPLVVEDYSYEETSPQAWPLTSSREWKEENEAYKSSKAPWLEAEEEEDFSTMRLYR